MVVISRNVDLSVGSVLGLSAYASTEPVRPRTPASPSRWSSWPGLGIGLACGVVNGFMVAAGRVPEPGRNAGHAVHHPRDRHPAVQRQARSCRPRCPTPSCRIPKSTTLGIPDVAIAVAVVIGDRRLLPAHVPLRPGAVRDRVEPGGGTAGRASPSAGACSPRSPSAARIAGIAGVLWAAQYGTIDSSAGTGYELQAVSAVVVGGVAIFGGSGSVIGAALGALLLSTISIGAVRARHLAVLGPGDLGLPAASWRSRSTRRSRVRLTSALRK